MNLLALEYLARNRTLELSRKAELARPALVARPTAFRLPSFRLPASLPRAARQAGEPCPTC